LKKVNRKKEKVVIILKKEKEIVRLENEVIISGIVFGMNGSWNERTKYSNKSPPIYTSSNYSSLELLYARPTNNIIYTCSTLLVLLRGFNNSSQS
jgi:hypothetical protein